MVRVQIAKRKVTLTTYMVVALMTLVLLVLPLGVGVFGWMIQRAGAERFVNQAATVSRLVADLMDAQDLNQPARVIAVLDRLVLSAPVSYADITYGEEQVRSSLMEFESLQFVGDLGFGEHDDNIYYISLLINQQINGLDVLLRLGFDETPVQQQNRQYWQNAAAFLLFYTLVFVTSIIVASRRLAQPIQHLGHLSQRIAAGEIHRQLAIKTGVKELDRLSIDLESMRCALISQTRQMERLSLRDSLTGIPNRLVLYDHLSQALAVGLRNNTPFALLVMDLDGFKKVNDTLGHQAGDSLLQEAALRLYSTGRGTDTAARLGGDEFAVLMPAAQREKIEGHCGMVAELIKAPYNISGQQIAIGVSMGVACYPEDGDNSEELMRKADLAMYHAKKSCQDFVFYESALDQNHSKQLGLRADLEGVLERQELVVYYQPKLNLRDKKIVSFEALLRWQHPQHGLLAPQLFIPLCEKMGDFIHQLTLYVLRQAAIDTLHWHELGFQMSVAVNISPKNLQLANFSQRVVEVLNEVGLAPAYVELELTENDILVDPPRAIVQLNKLQAAGVAIAIDDFGSGYSSLAYLKKLPINTVKIDKSFIIELQEDDDNVAIVRATIDMSRKIGLQVVAEGIETQYALDHLQRWGCNFGQGFYISKPGTVEDATALLLIGLSLGDEGSEYS